MRDEVCFFVVVFVFLNLFVSLFFKKPFCVKTKFLDAKLSTSSGDSQALSLWVSLLRL